MELNGELGYLTLLNHIKNNGIKHENRTGVDTVRQISNTLRFNLEDNKIPVLTTKKVHWKSVVVELLWFLSGQTNVNYLKDNGVRIWNEWANEDGSMGPIYGEQFRHQESYNANRTEHEYVDPLKKFINGIKENPDSRRNIISLWNGPLIDCMNLPPCHGIVIQASVINHGLYLEMYQRSADMFLGAPFNFASYGLFAHMIAKECGLDAKEFIWHGHDCHIYVNHFDQVMEQISRSTRPTPKIKLGYDVDLLSLLEDIKKGGTTYDDLVVNNELVLKDYDPHPTIKAEVAV